MAWNGAYWQSGGYNYPPHPYGPPSPYHTNWAGVPPNPQGYIPPAPIRSSKYPNLHPMLAADSMALRFDISKKPRMAIPPAAYYTTAGASAMAGQVTSMRLISKHFPWSIEINASPAITCEAVWDSLYSAMQEYLADSEWGLLEDKQRESIVKAAKKRVEGNSDGDKRLKRVDYLCGDTLFQGLYKDEGFATDRLLPGLKPCPETWVVKLSD
ncbi:hypothetical protein C8J56DRAFT_440326 [Mycena floridula]|nr:hypothetical protein C8J56DRAFT_440326 [Mycena floridula]